MPVVTTFPRHGSMRPGVSGQWVGGFGWGAWSGSDPTIVSSAAVLAPPLGLRGYGSGPIPGVVMALGQAKAFDEAAATEETTAATLAAEGAAALIGGNVVLAAAKETEAAQHAAKSREFRDKARELRKWGGAPPGIQHAPGRGIGLARVREWWATASTPQRAVVGGGGLLLAAKLLKFF